jgi:hemoglobin
MLIFRRHLPRCGANAIRGHKIMQDLTEDALRRLVDRFYAKVRRDARLGPIFERAIGDGWDRHLATMTDFWSSVMLTSGRYKGNPLAVHMRVEGIEAGLFPRWLELFFETTREEFPPEIAARLDAKASRIADSLSRALYYRPELDVAAG